MIVSGFKAAAVQAELRYKGRLDLGLILAEGPVAAAGVFTQNTVKAAPVLWSREKIAGGTAAAILVNAGQANACTGDQGMTNAADTARTLADAAGCDPDHVLMASTGVIGEQLNMDAMKRALPGLAANLRSDGFDDVARAMMTTDTTPKIVEARGAIDGVPFTVAGLAKGSGMIAPNMATMLCFVLTDAAVSSEYLKTALRRTVDDTLNTLTIDSDTSTNDCTLIMASGKAGNPEITNDQSSGAAEFEKALATVLDGLARMLAADGEGATKLVRINVGGAPDNAQARIAALAVANSPLVKTAMFGEDANWGRFMMAIGKSGVDFDPDQVDVSLDDVALVEKSRFVGEEETITAVMKKKEYQVHINLNTGSGQAKVWTCDFSYDYVKINADYRS